MQTYHFYVTFDGIISVGANTKEEAWQQLDAMSKQDIVSRADGTLELDFKDVEDGVKI